MNQDITYCTSTSCIHSLGCRRNLSNYKDERIAEMTRYSCIDGKHCQDNDFSDLIRFRLSDGSSMEVVK